MDFALLLPREDLAMPPLSWAGADSIHVGMKVYAVGHPYGYGYATTCGVISGVSNEHGGRIYFKTESELVPGNAGGPLVNEQGQLIGANTWVYEGTSLGFALPVERLQDVVTRYQGSLAEIRHRSHAAGTPSSPAAASCQTCNGLIPVAGMHREPVAAQCQAYADLLISYLLTELGYEHFIDDGMWVISRPSGEVWISISPDQTRIIFANRLARIPEGGNEAVYRFLLNANESKVGDCKLALVGDVVTLLFQEPLSFLNHTRVMSKLSFLLAVGEELRISCLKEFNAIQAPSYMEERFASTASFA
jgi:hypothetical protein